MSDNPSPQKKRSPTCQLILDEFFEHLRSDELIDDDSIDRLQSAFDKETILKPDDVQIALFPDAGDKA